MVGLVGLNDGQAGHPTPTGAADSLREQLISPFGGAFVGQIECYIGRHDAYQRDLRDVDAFGNETRADEDVEPALVEGVQDALDGPFVLGHVPIQAADPKVREGRLDFLLHPLGSAAEVADPGRFAGRTA